VCIGAGFSCDILCNFLRQRFDMIFLQSLSSFGLFVALFAAALNACTATIFLRKEEHRLAREYVVRRASGLSATAEMKQARLDVLLQCGCRIGFLIGVSLWLTHFLF